MSAPLIVALGTVAPSIAPDAFVAPGAVVIGDVTLAAKSSVWYGSVLRGDTAPISLGEGSNLQDLSVVHADPGFPATIGARVTVGHRAIIHGATIEDDVLVGMGAIVMNGAVIGRWSLLGAGAVVSPGVVIPPGSLVLGVPGRVVRAVGDEDRATIEHGVAHYQQLAERHRKALESS